MNRARLFFTLLLFCAVPVFAKEQALHYLAPDAIDVVKLLPGPPAVGTAEDRADIDAVLAKQKSRTPEESERAKSEAVLSSTAFQTVLGPKFTPANFPLTFRLLEDAAADGGFFAGQGEDALEPAAAARAGSGGSAVD